MWASKMCPEQSGPNGTGTNWTCCRKSGLIHPNIKKKKKKCRSIGKKTAFDYAIKKLINFLYAIQWPRTRTQLKRNMQQPPLAPYKIISIAFYKCFSQHVALCQNIKTWWWMATLWTVSLFHDFYLFSCYFCFDENTALTWGSSVGWFMPNIQDTHVKKKKKKEGVKINIFSPIVFTLQLSKKEKEQKSG